MRILFILFVTFIFLLAGCANNSAKYGPVELCLKEKGVEKYGVEWCPVCAKQKKLFGSDLEGIYIECLDRPQYCLDNNIEGYPTWDFPDGERHVGLLTPEELAEKAGCDCDCTGEVCICG